MGVELGMGFVGLVGMVLFWGGLILLALWLISLLFPAVHHLDDREAANSSEKKVISNDKTTF